MKSVFATMKSELGEHLTTHAETKRALFDDIELFSINGVGARRVQSAPL